MVYQRTCNHELFRRPAVGSSEDKRFGLMKVEYWKSEIISGELLFILIDI